jgi:hypothetical protein
MIGSQSMNIFFKVNVPAVFSQERRHCPRRHQKNILRKTRSNNLSSKTSITSHLAFVLFRAQRVLRRRRGISRICGGFVTVTYG